MPGDLAHDGIVVRRDGLKVLSKTIYMYMQLCELVRYVIIILYKYFMLLNKRNALVLDFKHSKVYSPKRAFGLNNYPKKTTVGA